MAENFDLIFGQNASQQYAWNDSDYQNGWETIGNIPPTAAQFDALQRRSDTKMKELNDELTPLVNAETADNRQPSTAYSEGDIKYSQLLPTGWFLACTVSGTSSASELVVPSPVAEGDEITDGGVTWKVKKIGGAGDAGDGVPLGAMLPLAHNSTIPAGYLLCDGSAVSRTMFPDLFAAIGTTYGAGDGSTTFNVPDYNVAKRFAQGDTVAGQTKAAGLPNITGSFSITDWNYPTAFIDTTSGAFDIDGSQVARYSNTGDASSRQKYAAVSIDASLSNPIYGNSDTVQPNALTVRYIIKAFDGQTADSALIDITQYANELAGKANINGSNMVYHKDVITTSGTYTAPATGVYKITVKGGGGGGAGGYNSSSARFGGGGGGEGGTTVTYVMMQTNDSATVVIGAGGTAGTANNNGVAGGDSSVTIDGTTYQGGGGGGGYSLDNCAGGAGGTGTIIGAPGGAGDVSGSTSAQTGGGTGGGAGGGTTGRGISNDGAQGGGGGGGVSNGAGSAGGDGYVWFEYYTPGA